MQVGEHGAGNLELSVPISNFGVHDAGTRSAISFPHAPFPRSATSAVPVDTLLDHLSDSENVTRDSHRPYRLSRLPLLGHVD